MTFSQKLFNVVTSVRFFQIFVVAVLQALVVFKVIDGAQGEALTQIIQTLLLGSVVIGSADSIATKSANVVTVAPTETATTEGEIQDLLTKLK